MSKISPHELRRRLNQQKADILRNQTAPIISSLESTTHCGVLVENWKHGWKWFSAWMLALIVFINTVPLPPELIAVLPPNMQHWLSVALAVVGFVGRFINQSHPQPLPPLSNEVKDAA